MKKNKRSKLSKKKQKSVKTTRNITGTYVYDKNLGKVVKVSNRIPKTSAKNGGDISDLGPCGQPYSGGTCPMQNDGVD